MRKLHFDVDGIISTFIKSRLSKLKKTKIHVLSHVHEKYIEDKGGQVIIHPGSWRDEYNLNPKTKKLTPRKKHYLQILMAENDLEYQLIHFPVKRTTLDLNEVIADEVKFIKKAAKEENFNLTLV